MDNAGVKQMFKEVTLTDTDIEQVSAKLKAIEVGKGEILLSAGQFVPYQYYVHSGCLRTYYLDDSGKEHTIQFAVNDWWISDYTAFFTGGRSILCIECIQDGV